MKIVFSTESDNLNSPLDRRFGRAAYLLLYDLEHDSFEAIENRQNLNAAQGAGIQAAETTARLGASALITGGHCGPKAFRVLTAAGIDVFATDAATAAQALELYRSGKLTRLHSENVAGHWT